MKYVYVYQIYIYISQFFYPLLLLSELMFPMVLVLVVGVTDLWVPSVPWFDRVKMSETKKMPFWSIHNLPAGTTSL